VAIWPGWSVSDGHLSQDKWPRTDSSLGLLTQHAQHTRTSPATGTVSGLTTYNRTIALGFMHEACWLELVYLHLVSVSGRPNLGYARPMCVYVWLVEEHGTSG
jgi:hypothetical protein